ncbi:MAG TPA: hypothetical protein VGM90_31160 [Kofleriaceae bacterium]|jgi:hypothetical protein
MGMPTAFVRWAAACVLLSSAIDCAHPPAANAPPVVAPPPTASPVAVEPPLPALDDREVLRRLDLKFGTTGDVTIGDGLSLSARQDVYRAFIRDRVTQRGFYESVMGDLKLKHGRGDPVSMLPPLWLTLKTSEAKQPFFYLDQPCATKDLVSVAPWWDLGSTVKVCKDSYKPEIESFSAGNGGTVYCDATYYKPLRAWVESPCKCGANLINCAPNMDVQKTLVQAFADEQTLTVQYVVQNHLPFGKILTLADSVRSDWADFFYARSQFIATKQWNYPKPTGETKLRSRPEPLTAGILSTWPWMVKTDSYRLIVREMWEQYLCQPLASRQVTPAEILTALGGPQNVSKGKFSDSVRMELTKAPGCQTCHKILENASRAMQGYTLMQNGGHYIPENAYHGDIQFFVGDVSSPRAEGPGTMQWLGETIAAQPEFNACMVKKVLGYVYDGFAYKPELAKLLEKKFTNGQDFAALVEDAVVARYLGTWPDSKTP